MSSNWIKSGFHKVAFDSILLNAAGAYDSDLNETICLYTGYYLIHVSASSKGDNTLTVSLPRSVSVCMP